MELFQSSPHTLAEKLRPTLLEHFIGQEHLLGKSKPLRILIEKDKIQSLIFYGPPGTGKTTLAKLISRITRSDFIEVNATDSSVKEIRSISKAAADKKRFQQQRTILFIDEVHRFNKAQQDVLLPFVEKGDVIFIGATTFNPFFYITPALNSRTLIFEFYKLNEIQLGKILQRALENSKLNLEEEARKFLIHNSNGDARVLLNRLEILFSVYEEPVTLSKKEVFEIFPKHAFSYERADDHYDVISAFIKSIRGSDPDAAIYWLAVMLEGGEDPRFVARRLAILAAEDIGLAEPGALAVINGGYDLVEKIGMPEARIILSEMTVYLASLPKSNSAYMAVEKALNHVRNNPVMRVPDHLKDSHYAGAKKLGRGKGYQYSHDFPYHYVKQNYTEKPVSFYEPGTLGREKKFKEYLEFLKTLKTR
jgi:putative ATPase